MDSQGIWKPDYNTAQTIWQPDPTWQPNNNNTGIWQPPVEMANNQQQWRAPVTKNKTGKDSENKMHKVSA